MAKTEFPLSIALTHCPTCKAEWAEERLVTTEVQTLGTNEPAKHTIDWYVTCTNGHRVEVKNSVTIDNRRSYVVINNETVRVRGVTIRAADGPCPGCGKEIQPGQLYVVRTGRHFGCL